MPCPCHLIVPNITFTPLLLLYSHPIFNFLPSVPNPNPQLAIFMASLPKPAPVRRLHELLKEKQEPFLLDVYLLEKGYSKKCSHSETRNRQHLGKSCKKQSSCGSNSRKEALPKSSNLLKSVLTRLVSGKNSRTLNCIGKSNDDGRFDTFSDVSGIWKMTQGAELNGLSFGSGRLDSSPSPENALSASEGHRALKLCPSQEEAAVGRKFQWECTGDCKQFSPVSVLEVLSDEGSPGQQQKLFSPRTCKKESTSTSSLNLPREVIEDSILSASLWDLIMNLMKEKLGLELLGSAFYFQYMKTKRILQRTKQLLFDCVMSEVVENHGIQSRRWNFHEYLGPEMLGKIICDKILSWSKRDGDVANVTQLLESDFKDFSKQWNHFQPQIKEIAIELGDGIFENIIDDIVTDLLDLLN